MTVNVIESTRLRLRPFEMDDFEAFAAFSADGERNRFRGGGRSRIEAWNEFCAIAGQWSMRGIGVLAVEERETGQTGGFAGLWFPIDVDEPELMWSLYPDFEGTGYATEAARAMQVWAHEARGLPPLMSFMNPDNTASRKVAERLGATLEGACTFRGRHTLIYRHVMPEAKNEPPNQQID